MTWVIVLAIAALIALFAVLVRSSLNRLRDAVRQSWSGLDALLLERHDLLPRLVDLCARYMPYEPEASERVIRADTAVFLAATREDIPALAAADMALRAAVAALLALAENYPKLCADPDFLELRERVTCIDEAITERRELYNSAVNLLNVRSAAFPHRMIAYAAGFRPAALFE